MKYKIMLMVISFAVAGSLVSQHAQAGRYDGITEIFNKAARGDGISGSFNKASGSTTLPNKGDLTYDFNKAARPSETNYNSPQPTLTPYGGPPNNTPNF